MSNASRWWLPAMLAAGVLSAAPPARAQQTGPYREGFWIGVGAGWGSAAIACSSCPSQRRVGSVATTLRMGGTLTRQLLLGGELNAWSRNHSGITETVGDMSVVLYFYPTITGTVFLKGGIGIVIYNADASPRLESGGGGVNVGVGMDLYLGRKFSLTPYASFVGALNGNLRIGGEDTGVAAKPNLFLVGVAATWH